MVDRTYIAIDLKSFYASVECTDRGLDPMSAYLVVADRTRTSKTICLAVSPALKAFGIPGRARLWEVQQKSPVEFIIAPPRMQRYMEVSGKIVETYLKYVSMDDMHVYSIDEVFIDATDYIRLYGCSAHELAMKMIRDVLATTGITATAGIGSNLYLCKVAMDILAKRTHADADGVRIAELDEMGYRKKLWNHKPITDFWRIGKGTASKLASVGITTMGELARKSLSAEWEKYLYKRFGIAAELMIDHAWGWEPCTIEAIKAYKAKDCSLSSGQVLKEPYPSAKALIVMKEMVTKLVLDLISKRLLTDQITITIDYDRSAIGECYTGETRKDFYGRLVPKPAHGSATLGLYSSSERLIQEKMQMTWDRIVDRRLSIRRMTISACHLITEDMQRPKQLELFDPQERDAASNNEKERKMQDAILALKEKFGKNSILRGIDFLDGATTIERNAQIGGHKA